MISDYWGAQIIQNLIKSKNLNTERLLSPLEAPHQSLVEEDEDDEDEIFKSSSSKLLGEKSWIE